MIEPTDEMERAYDDAAWENPVELGGLEMANVRDGLAAVLAIVERYQDERYARLLAANRKLVDRLHELEHIEDERDRALGALEDARRQLARKP